MSTRNARSIAYFTMEIVLDHDIPTYSGGLGALAGDTIRSAADLEMPMAVVTLLYRKGYFHQRIDDSGWQTESDHPWQPEAVLQEMPARARVSIEGRTVQLRAWRYDVRGHTGHDIPVFLLDSDLPENAPEDRHLTDHLYGGDDRYRLCQEVILGIGGVRMLRALGQQELKRFHMNEGHAALLTIELIDELVAAAGRKEIVAEDIEEVRRRCVFTTHTPVAAGHDQFPLDLVDRVLGQRSVVIDRQDLFCVDVFSRIFHGVDEVAGLREMAAKGVNLNLTYLALNLSGYVNGVAKKHGEVSRRMFAGYAIDEITNGIHAGSWVSPSVGELFDRYIDSWRGDNYSLRYALSIRGDELFEAHQQAKRALFATVRERTGVELDPGVFTLGFGRRAARYKRGDLLFTDLDRLRAVAANGGLQIVYAGKAHPKDDDGKEIIRRIHNASKELGSAVPLVYLEDYDVALAKLMTSGVDVWLNTPLAPNEASGTSGMKAALNGVPSLSVPDGWWIEGHIEDVTGWSIGRGDEPGSDQANDASSLYGKLEHKILPMYYSQRDRFIDVMRHAIALNGAFFNTQRMVQQYAVHAYLR